MKKDLLQAAVYSEGSQIAYQTAYCGFDVRMSSGIEEASQEPARSRRVLENADVINADGDAGRTTPGTGARGIADYDSFDKEACLAKASRHTS